MKYRPQRGGLAESMAEAREFTTRKEFLEYIKKQWAVYDPCEYDEIEVRKYGVGIDTRIDWDTYIVCIRGKGVGFTDGPLP
jgi:hypothetical protein